MPEGFALPDVFLVELCSDGIEQACFVRSPSRREQFVAGRVRVYAVDDDVRTQQADSPYDPGNGFLLAQKGQASRVPLVSHGCPSTNEEVVDFDAADRQAIDKEDGLFKVRELFFGEARDDVNTDLDTQIAGGFGPLCEAGGIVATANAAERLVVGALESEIKPCFGPGGLGKELEFFLIQAVRTSAQGKPCKIREAVQFSQELLEFVGRAVGVGKGLEIG